jgi:hypothetical protein
LNKHGPTQQLIVSNTSYKTMQTTARQKHEHTYLKRIQPVDGQDMDVFTCHLVHVYVKQDYPFVPHEEDYLDISQTELMGKFVFRLVKI